MVECVGTQSDRGWKKGDEVQASIELAVSEVKLHGGGNREDKPVADRGRATARDDMYQDDVPFW